MIYGHTKRSNDHSGLTCSPLDHTLMKNRQSKEDQPCQLFSLIQPDYLEHRDRYEQDAQETKHNLIKEEIICP